MFINAYCSAYHCALFHAERLVALTNEQDPDTLEHLLFLNEAPDKLVSDQKAFETCHKILALDPANKYAKETLKKLKKISLKAIQRKAKKKF